MVTEKRRDIFVSAIEMADFGAIHASRQQLDIQKKSAPSASTLTPHQMNQDGFAPISRFNSESRSQVCKIQGLFNARTVNIGQSIQ